MSSWKELEEREPDLVKLARTFFDAHKHKTMATLRKDGSPRISGTEVEFKDGEVWLGSMPNARKAQDLLRDPRVAIHSGSDDPPTDDQPGDWTGDAKLAGTATEVTDPAIKEPYGEHAPPGPFHLFKVDVTELVVTRLGEPADHLVVDYWTADGGRKSVKRT
jgi:hypothetical protein